MVLNVLALTSMILWKKRKSLGEDSLRSLKKDRYRLYATFYAFGLTIALVGKSVQGVLFWTALSGALILLSTHDTVRTKFNKSDPKTYATVTTLHMTVGTCIILGSAAYFFSELAFLMSTLTAPIGVLLVLMWVQTYRTRSFN